MLLIPEMTQEAGKHLCLMVTRLRGRYRVAPPTLFKCLESFRDKLIAMDIQNVSMPVSDMGRVNVDFQDLYAILALICSGTDISVHLHDRFYLTDVW